MIRIDVLFLGPARDLAKTECASLEVADGTTAADLQDILSKRYPGLRGTIGSIRLAVNETFVDEERVLESGDEVALVPPVSGGAGDEGILVDLVVDPIPVERVRAFVMGDPKLGGIVTFEGATRREQDPEHGPVVRLDYEGYEGMARQQLERLAREAKERWSAGRIALVHRLGAVPVGDVSVMIAVACAHRAESFDACRWLIDTLKKDVPIWKQDVFADGYVRWVKPTPPA